MANVTLTAQDRLDMYDIFFTLFTELESPPPTKEAAAQKFAEAVADCIVKAEVPD